MRGGFLHGRLGDRLLDKELWRASPQSVARAWLIGFPITSIPWLPFQSVIAGILCFTFRGNMLLAIALQYLSNPFTAIIHLPPCYFVGKLLMKSSPAQTWHEMMTRDWKAVFLHPSQLAHDLLPLYLGAITLGFTIGILGYFVILAWGARRASRLAVTRTAVSSEAGDI